MYDCVFSVWIEMCPVKGRHGVTSRNEQVAQWPSWWSPVTTNRSNPGGQQQGPVTAVSNACNFVYSIINAYSLINIPWLQISHGGGGGQGWWNTHRLWWLQWNFATWNFWDQLAKSTADDKYPDTCVWRFNYTLWMKGIGWILLGETAPATKNQLLYWNPDNQGLTVLLLQKPQD